MTKKNNGAGGNRNYTGIKLFPRHYALLWTLPKNPVDFIVPFSTVWFLLLPLGTAGSWHYIGTAFGCGEWGGAEALC